MELHEHKLPDGRTLIAPWEEIEIILKQELREIGDKLAVLKPKVDRDIKESREQHRKLWNY